MTTRYTIHVPLYTPDGDPSPERLSASIADFAERMILPRFDGATVTWGVGYWRNPRTGEVERDDVEVWTVDATPADAGLIVRLASHIARYARQQAVYVTATDAAGFRRAEVSADDWRAGLGALYGVESERSAA